MRPLPWTLAYLLPTAGLALRCPSPLPLATAAAHTVTIVTQTTCLQAWGPPCSTPPHPPPCQVRQPMRALSSTLDDVRATKFGSSSIISNKTADADFRKAPPT